MITPDLNNRIGSTMATIAVSQMLLEKIRSLVKLDRYDITSLGINSSLDLVVNLAKAVNMSYEEIVELITDYLSEKDGKTINFLDKLIRNSILVSLNAMVSCANSPIISDYFMYQEEGGKISAATSPIKVNVNILDSYNLFMRATPTGRYKDFFYGDVPKDVTPAEVWKSGDLNAFLWYVINMVEPGEHTGATLDKISWDNRNPEFKNYLSREDLSQYPCGDMETYNGEDAEIFWGSDSRSKRAKFFIAEYNDTTNCISIQINKDIYGPRKKFCIKYDNNDATTTGETGSTCYERNATIFNFNKDYINNLRILYLKPIIASITDALLNNSISIMLNGNLSLDQEIIRGEISKILTKVIESEDTEIEDCYFTFSNDEYDALVKEAELRKNGVLTVNSDTIRGESPDLSQIIDAVDTISESATIQENKTVIKNTITAIAEVKSATDTTYEWGLTMSPINFQDSLKSTLCNFLNVILMKFVECILTPKVILIFLINYKFANGVLPKNPLDLLSVFIKMLIPIIREINNEIIEHLFKNILERLKESMLVYALEKAKESLEKYKDIVMGLIAGCTINLAIPSFGSRMIGNIDNVVGADILETKQSPDKENC